MATAIYDDPSFSKRYTITTAQSGDAAKREVTAYAWNREWSMVPLNKYTEADVLVQRHAELWAKVV